mgnify:FL=1
MSPKGRNSLHISQNIPGEMIMLCEISIFVRICVKDFIYCVLVGFLVNSTFGFFLTILFPVQLVIKMELVVLFLIGIMVVPELIYDDAVSLYYSFGSRFGTTTKLLLASFLSPLWSLSIFGGFLVGSSIPLLFLLR